MIDVLDRVLDKGIVVDWWLRMSVAGIGLVAVEGKMLVTAIETHLGHSHAAAEVFGQPVYSSPEGTRLAPNDTQPAKVRAAGLHYHGRQSQDGAAHPGKQSQDAAGARRDRNPKRHYDHKPRRH